MEINKIYNENCLTGLKNLPDNSIDCCVTSPPYFGLRDYGTDEQIGLEETPELFIASLVEVFTEVKRVLKKEGSLWLNLGDSYMISKGVDCPPQTIGGQRGMPSGFIPSNRRKQEGLKNKDLIGIPWMAAFALRSAGWYLRQDIIWHKPNPMPESVTDRCTKSHEYIFLLSKSAKYYYNADSIKQPLTESSKERLTQDLELQVGIDRVPGKTNGKMKAVGQYVGGRKHKNLDLPNAHTIHKTRNSNGQEWESDGMANKRSVWTVTTRPYSEAHFATFPERLIIDCIKAGCPEGGIVLDPFMGAGTTALVARKLNRNYIGFELNPEYIKIAEKRLRTELGIFL